MSADPCAQLLTLCSNGEPWSQSLLRDALRVDEGRAFLSTVVEPLADLFEPRLSGTYKRLFADVMVQAAPNLVPRLRATEAATAAPAQTQRVYVLSRITLGADVAVTSVILDAVKKKYPTAEMLFAGPRKCYELFETDSRIHHVPAPYARGGSLQERLNATASLWFDDGLVVDPDSRLTQLGLVSVCDERNYLHFPSRSYGGESNARLPDLAAQWAHEVFGIADAKPYIAPSPSSERPADVTVSLGVGGNAAKGLSPTQERDLIKILVQTGRSIIIDEGGDETERLRVQQSLNQNTRTHSGSFASFASLIQQSKLYVGYDSAGGHIASACGVPLISIAKGFASERMAARWRPLGTVLNADDPDLFEKITYTSRHLRSEPRP